MAHIDLDDRAAPPSGEFRLPRLRLPRLRSHLAYRLVSPDIVILSSERGDQVLRGAAYCDLVPLLDGRHTVPEIVRRLSPRVGALTVWVALARLEGKGLLADGAGPAPSPAGAFWSALGVDPGEASERAAKAEVEVECLGGAGSRELQSALAALGIRAHGQVPGEGGRPSLRVIVADDYLRPELAQVNADALCQGRPWMLVRPGTSEFWIGPLFVPAETGCWECLAARLRLHRLVESPTEGGTFVLQPPPAFLGSTVAAAANLAATEIARWAIAGTCSVTGSVLTLSLPDYRLARHILVRRPQCRACGAPRGASRPVTIELASRPKLFTADGGHRSVTPERTVDDLRHLVSPVTGIVAALASGGSGDPEHTPLYTVFPACALLEEALGLRNTLLHGTGKGKTGTQAQASAIGEAVERYSALYTGEIEASVTSRLADLGEAAVPPERLLNFSAAQYESRDAWNAANASAAEWVPERFDETRDVAWGPVWSLTRRALRYVPAAMCYFRHPPDPGPSFAVCDSNGNASGNNLEEAILQGMMELVERDAAGIWWLNRVRRPGVDLSSFGDAYLEELERFYARRGRRLWVLDVTTDLRIAAFVAVSVLDTEAGNGITLGFGAHLDPAIAVLRAVTECNQMTWWRADRAVVSRRGEDAWREEWHEHARLADHPYLIPSPGERPRVHGDFECLGTNDLRDDVLEGVRRMSEHGLEVLVLDQTRPDLGLRAVKVFVPGLRHFRRRLAPGRLYEVPVRLGWLPAPLPEAELNPLPMPA